MLKQFGVCTVILAICNFGLTQSPEPVKDPLPPSPVSAPNEVIGLKLPVFKDPIKYDEGFVTVVADTKGEVQWLVLSTNAKVKFRVTPSNSKEITLAVPPFESIVSIFAVANPDGKLTNFARTDLVISGPAPPPVNPIADVKLPLHLNIIEDPFKRTPATRAIIDDAAFRGKLDAAKVKMRVFASSNAAELAKYKFDAVLKVHQPPVMILQDNNGTGLVIQTLPQTQTDLIKILSTYVGGLQ